jgi:uncharacterized protein YcbX
MTARLARILIYPIKSLDPVEVQEAEVLPSGALRHDRSYALVDAEGNSINGKRAPLVHRVRATFDLHGGRAELRRGNDAHSFRLREGREHLEACLSGWLDQPVRLVENLDNGFPDDLESPGPTVVSTPTLKAVSQWFDGLTDDEVRRRFRANLEIDGGPELLPPFWEDRLVAPAGSLVRFRVGDLTLAGTNPCQRCVVPTRDTATGDPWPQFARTFAQYREASLPPWAQRSRFDHFYRLSVNTRLVGSGGTVRLGDVVEILDGD